MNWDIKLSSSCVILDLFGPGNGCVRRSFVKVTDGAASGKVCRH